MLSAFIEAWVETRLLPTLTRAYPCRFTVYVADPVSSIQVRRRHDRSAGSDRVRVGRITDLYAAKKLIRLQRDGSTTATTNSHAI